MSWVRRIAKVRALTCANCDDAIPLGAEYFRRIADGDCVYCRDCEPEEDQECELIR